MFRNSIISVNSSWAKKWSVCQFPLLTFCFCSFSPRIALHPYWIRYIFKGTHLPPSHFIHLSHQIPSFSQTFISLSPLCKGKIIYTTPECFHIWKFPHVYKALRRFTYTFFSLFLLLYEVFSVLSSTCIWEANEISSIFPNHLSSPSSLYTQTL